MWSDQFVLSIDKINTGTEYVHTLHSAVDITLQLYNAHNTYTIMEYVTV